MSTKNTRPGAPSRAQTSAEQAQKDYAVMASAATPATPPSVPAGLIEPRAAAEHRLAGTSRALAAHLRLTGETMSRAHLARWAGCTAAEIQPALDHALNEGTIEHAAGGFRAATSRAR
jgi:hypothetical protein